MEASTIPFRILLCVIFSTVGFLGNFYKINLFFNLDFLFGSFFSMLAILVLGRYCGIVTAFAAGSCTYLLWNHPWAIIIFTGEAIFVSWLYAKHKGNLVFYDLFYWVCLGIPLIFLFYHYVMSMAFQTSLVVMLKQSINGIFNTLLAVLAYTGLKFFKKTEGIRVSYSELLFVVLATFALVPAMFLSISAIKTYEKNGMERLQSEVAAATQIAQKNLMGWVTEYHNHIQTLARLIGDPNSRSFLEMQHDVETIYAATPAFKGIGVFDNRSISVSYYPMEQDGKSNLGVDMSFRPHIPIMRKDKQPFITDMLVSKLGDPSPIVILLAPILKAGEYRGYCSGVLRTSNLSGFLKNLKIKDINITLIDGQNRVIVSTAPDFTKMAPFTRPYLSAASETDDYRPILWQAETKSNTSLIDRWRNSFIFSSVPIATNCHWRLIVESSLQPLAEDISRYSLRWLILQGLLIIASVLLSNLLSNKVMINVKKLQIITRLVPQWLNESEKIDWPNSAIEEIADLSNNFRHMTAVLVSHIAEQRATEGELRESQAKLEAALSSIVDAISISDSQGNFIHLNEAFAIFHRFASKYQCLGTLAEYPGLLEMFQDNGDNAPLEMWPASRALRGEAASNVEYTLRRKDSGESWIGSYSFAPIRDNDGMIVGSVVVGRDITELKRQEGEKKALQAQLIQAQKMEAIGTLAGGIAHDFNNILGAILGYAEMAKDASPLDSEIAQDIDQIMASGHRAAALVKQILAFSRQGNTDDMFIEPKHLIKEVIKLLRPALPSTIQIIQNLDANTRNIQADPTQLHQVVMNLCTNAFHAMEKNGGTLEITLNDCVLTAAELQHQTTVQPGNFVKLSIRDTGPGIPKEIQDRIFDPYFTTKEVGKGTGLGLAIVHGIICSLGGFISCESEPNKGTEFHVFIPAIDSSVNPSAEKEDFDMTGKESILLVDDEKILAEMTKTMLERLGYRVTVRLSSLEALTVFRNKPDEFDLVLTDQTMPGMTGVDLARIILQIRPTIPIILCTGYSSIISEEQAYQYGIRGFIPKPYRKEELMALLRKVLDPEKLIQ